MKISLSTITLLLLALAGCNADRGGDAATTPATPAPAPVSEAPAIDEVAVPPSQPEVLPASGPMPAEGAIGFAGFGPARWGANQEEVRMAWGKDLGDAKPSEPGGCYYLFPQPKPEAGYRLGFMLEGDKFVRIDVDTPDIVAPGGGKVGMSADEIRKHYAGRIEEWNHKYVEGGKYLRIKDTSGGNGLLVFEADAAGRIGEWRIGVPPQVDYVEGCS